MYPEWLLDALTKGYVLPRTPQVLCFEDRGTRCVRIREYPSRKLWKDQPGFHGYVLGGTAYQSERELRTFGLVNDSYRYHPENDNPIEVY